MGNNITVLIEDELVDTYGGNFTYKMTGYAIKEGVVKFYDQHYGAKPSDWEEIDDKEEIKELIINFKEEING